MTITYPVDFPSLPNAGFVHIRWTACVAGQISPGDYDAVDQVAMLQGQWWEMEARLSAMERDDADEWDGWRLSLNGQEGTFLLGHPNGKAPRGAGGGTPVVDGAANVGAVLPTRGWPLNTLVLKRGDWLQIGTGVNARLHRMTAPATSDGSGLAALDIWPFIPIGRAWPDGEALILTNPRGLFRMVSNEMPSEIDIHKHYNSMAFACNTRVGY